MHLYDYQLPIIDGYEFIASDDINSYNFNVSKVDNKDKYLIYSED